MRSKFDERLVATSLPTDGQLRVIFAVVGVLVIALVAIAPYALKTTHGTEIFLPAYAAAIFVVEVTTATILLATFRVRGSVHLLILASGYLLSGMLSLPWALTFPGVFTTLGLDHSLQSTAWLAALRRIGFASAVVGYALIGRNWVVRSPSSWVLGCVAVLTAFVTLVVWMTVSGAEGFPLFMLDARHVGPAWRYVPIAAFVLYGIGMIALVIRRQSTLDIWICVVLFSLGVETFLLSHMGGAVRLSVGWWSGRLFGLIAAGSILLVLLSETTGNYMRLARATANDRRARANRFMAMEALSASIAHEINQPLSSMVNNANAGLRWLSRDDPQVERAQQALQMIADEGHRADKIVSGIRQMFLTGAQERLLVDLRSVIDDALKRGAQDRALGRVEVTTIYPPEPKFVVCNPIQLVQVVSNLLDNAVDAMKESDVRKRLIVIRVCDGISGEVEVSFADTGTGVSPDLMDGVFLPFVSGKPEGMGMGLMFCRSVIEAHGGRVWIAANGPTGAEFCFTLPVAATPIEQEA